MEPSNKLVQIYIMSRDRASYLADALDSVIESSNDNVEIIVSDNSVGSAVADMMAKEYSSIKYTRRFPPQEAIEHFRSVFREASGEYFVVFHDDDLMMPTYVDHMLVLIESNPDVIAVGCNAKKMRGHTKTEQLFFRNIDQPVLVRYVEELLRPYFRLGLTSPPPFPSYMYRRRLVSGVLPDRDQGGKFCDTSFLVKLLHHGPIIWNPAPLMWYRFHFTNDSGRESITDRLSLLRYLINHEGVSRTSSDLIDFKFSYWGKWWLQRSDKRPVLPHGWRERIVFFFLAKKFLKICITRATVWQLIYRKIVQSFMRPS